ncbi:hypothetical protein [Aquincola agrisoli]|uniref:hypothetical protein n=1 Tax=Aquincola TaxID=391952 RepID=UPI002FBE992F
MPFIFYSSAIHAPRLAPWPPPAAPKPGYDILPMRWKPDAALGLPDYGAFVPDELAAASA